MNKIILICSLIVCTSGCNRLSDDIQIDWSTAGEPGFLMSDNLMGTIAKSSSRKEIGGKVTFVGLKSRNPKVIFESGMTSPLQKIYETESTLTAMLLASGSGSIDAFVIDKKTGKFAHATAGSVAGVYATAAVGTCK